MDENTTQPGAPHVCPCYTQYDQQLLPQTFIGNDYYCESRNSDDWNSPIFFHNDPLWDGKQCSDQEMPCCNSTSMLRFTKSLIEESNSQIEIMTMP